VPGRSPRSAWSWRIHYAEVLVMPMWWPVLVQPLV